MIDVEWLPGAATFVGRLIRAPLRVIPADVVVPILQGPLRGKRWIVGSSIHRVWLGAYETRKMQLSSRLLREGDTAFDIGANVGVYTLLFSDLVGASGQVVAFEPATGNLEYLRRHLFLNDTHNAEIVDAAVAAFSGVASFEPGRDRATGHLDQRGPGSVRVVAVDEYVMQTGRVPRLLKIDVEGAELDVLEGARMTLDRFKPFVLLAVHSSRLKQSCLECLASSGYITREIDADPSACGDELLAEPPGAASRIATEAPTRGQ